MTPTRRGVLAGAAGLASGASAGCLGLGDRASPPLVEAAGVVPAGDGYLAGGTTGREALDRAPLGTFVAGLSPEGAVRFRRHHGPGRWPGTDRVTACCPLGDGALLVGATTREAVVVDDVLVHAVAPDGRTRWRRTLPAAARAVDAVATPSGPVVAAVDDAGARPAAWVGGLAPDGRVRWDHRVDGRVPATVLAAGDGTVAVGGHAAGDRAVPWLLAVARGSVVARRRYDAGALAGWRLAALLGDADPARALLVPLVPAVAAGAAGRVLALTADWRADGRAPLALARDRIRAQADERDEDAVRFAGALPAGEAGLAAAVREGGWTTVATFDGGLDRVGETVRQARTTAVDAGRDGALLLAGFRRVGVGTREAWVTAFDTAATLTLSEAYRWTTTFPVG